MPVRPGDTVHVHYTGTLADGTEFDSSRGREPLTFVAGSGQVIAGFDEAVIGMEPGQTQTVTLPAEEAYGERDEDRVVMADRAMLPPDVRPSVGDQVVLGTEEGQRLPAWIVDLDEESVTLDANHPLAGEALTFEITLERVEPAQPLDPKSPLGLPPEA